MKIEISGNRIIHGKYEDGVEKDDYYDHEYHIEEKPVMPIKVTMLATAFLLWAVLVAGAVWVFG